MKNKTWSLIVGLTLITPLMPIAAIGQTPLPRGETQVAQSESLEQAQQLFEQAQELRKQGEYAEAQGLYEQVLSLMEEALGAEHPDLAQIYFSLGIVDHRQQKFSAASQDYETAVELNPQFWPANANLGLIAYEQGKIPKAIQYWQSAVAIEESTAEPKLALAIAHYQQGQREQGLSLGEEALKLDVQYADLDKLEENLWGERLLADAEAFLNHERMQTFISEANKLVAREIKGKLDSNSQTTPNGEYYNFYILQGREGQRIIIDLISKEFDGIVGLADSEENLIARNDNGSNSNNARINVALPTTGTYMILVLGKPKQTGNYRLNWREATVREQELAKASRLNQQVLELYKQGQYVQAIPLAKRALTIRQQLYEADHPHIADSLNNLALLYHNLGRYSEAEPLFQQALALSQRALRQDHPHIADSLNNLGELYRNQGKYSEAEPLFQQALALSQRLEENHPHVVAVSLNNLGELYRNQGKYSEAEPLFQQALALSQRLEENHPHVVADSLNNLGELYRNQGRYSKAEPLFQQALALSKRALGENHPYIVASLNNLAALYQSQGRYSEAEPLFQQALALSKRALGENHPHVAASLNNLALLYQSQGRYSEAEPLLQQALALSKRALGKKHPHVAASLKNLALLYQSQGRYNEAEPLLQQALALSKRALGENHPHVAASLNQLAGLYHNQGRYSEAEPLFQQALALSKRVLGENHPHVAASLNNLALLYESQGRYSEAEPLFQQALALRKQVLGKNHPHVAESFNGLALLYESQGRYSEAEFLHKQALTLRKRVLGENHPDVVTSLHNLAFLHYNQGRYSEAEPLFQQALALSKRVLREDNPHITPILEGLASLHYSQGRYSEAESLFQQSLALRKQVLKEDHPFIAASLNNLALLYRNQGKYNEAEPLLQQALVLSKRALKQDHPQIAVSLNNLALLYQSQGRYSEAVAFLKRGTNVEEAVLSRNLAIGSEQQKRTYLETFKGTSDYAISLHLRQVPENQEAAKVALRTILRRKGRVLDVLGNSLRRLRANLTPEAQELFEVLSQVQTQLSQLAYTPNDPSSVQPSAEAIAELEAKAQDLQAELINISAEFRQEVAPVAISQVQDKIPADAALLEFIQYRPFNPKTEEYGSPRYAVYILRSSGEVQWADLGEATAIDENIQSLRNALKSRQPVRASVAVVPAEGELGNVNASAQELYRQLLTPILEAIGDADHLLIAPDSQLNLVPFAALVNEDNRYLLQDYRITYLTSGRDLLRFQLEGEESQPPLLFANPAYQQEGEVTAQASRGNNQRSADLKTLQFGPLPGTVIEGEAIKDLLPQFQLLTEREASESLLKQNENPRFLHIATHGFFLPPEESELPSNQGLQPIGRQQPLTIENPLLRSGLALAGFNLRQSGEEEDGVLTALEVTGLNLRGTELVVLSACETGLGEVVQGEGVYGLRRAFTLAGAQTQLMSLWKVDDEQTKNLMIDYYQRLQNGEGRGEALRQVQLEMLNNSQTEHPYFWASFIPTGNWQALESSD